MNLPHSVPSRIWKGAIHPPTNPSSNPGPPPPHVLFEPLLASSSIFFPSLLFPRANGCPPTLCTYAMCRCCPAAIFLPATRVPVALFSFLGREGPATCCQPRWPKLVVCKHTACAKTTFHARCQAAQVQRSMQPNIMNKKLHLHDGHTQSSPAASVGAASSAAASASAAPAASAASPAASAALPAVAPAVAFAVAFTGTLVVAFPARRW